MEQEQEKAQCWTSKRRAALIVKILRGDTSVQEAARQHDPTVAEIEQWKEKFLAVAENALRSRPLDEEEMKDCEVVGYKFALRGRAKEAERALEQACLKRCSTLRPVEQTSVIRSDNGLVFQSRRFREACRFYRLKQEYITPYTLEQNGMIERFFRSIKEECVAVQRREFRASERKGAGVDWVVQ